MEDVLSLTPALPSDFLDLCERAFPWTEYIFVWHDDLKHKRAYCTNCKKEFSIDINEKRTVTPEARELFYQKHNDVCICPSCKASVIYKDRWRGRGKLWEEAYLYYYQALKNGGLVLRTFYLHKSYEFDIKNVAVEYSEHQRVYYSQGNCLRFRRYPNFSPRPFYFCDWYNAEIADSAFHWTEIDKIGTPTPWSGRMYGSFKGNINFAIDNNVFLGDFKYSCLKEYLEKAKSRNYNYQNDPMFTAANYLALFQKNSGLLEKMMKQGFKDLLHRHFYNYNCRFMINFNKPDVYSATKLSKGAIRAMKEITPRAIFKAQLTEVYKISPKNADYILLQGLNYNGDAKDWIRRIKREGSEAVNRFIKYLRKQNIWPSDYNDYLQQLAKLNMPLTQDNLFPNSFKAAHQNLTAELNRLAEEKRKAKQKLEKQKALKEQKKFEVKYKKLCKAVCFEDNNFIIRPALGDAELLQESNSLSHCVYACYKDKYRQLKTIICLIRKKSAPDKPFFTLEINPQLNHIIQCRGKGNCAPTEEVAAFRDKWFSWLQSEHREEKQICLKTA